MPRFLAHLARRTRRVLRLPYPASLRRADERVVLAQLDAIEAKMWAAQATEYRREIEGR